MTNVVKVKFKRSIYGTSGNEYSYMTDLDIKVGDQVIVDSPSDGYQVVVVTRLLGPLEDNSATKWIVSKVDDKEYKLREESRRRRAVIEAKLKAIEKEVSAKYRFNHLAAFSPEAAELIKELDKL